MTPPDAILAIPEGWVIDDIARERLGRQLARADDGICGVAAVHRDLLPGTSYRVVAERASLDPASEASVSRVRSVRGAVLVRPGVAVEVGDDVTVDGDVLLVDRGAAVHDPWCDLGRLERASPLGRPPFPYRPVVLFIGTENDPDLADWVRRTVNDLIRGNTEGRIAVPEPTGGLHLTRPCTPSIESVVALVPDVVVALDPDAVRLAVDGVGAARSATIVEMTRDTTAAVELVSWQIGRAQGRTRARIGRGIGAASLATLVRRLCAAPQPLPPSDRDLRAAPRGKVHYVPVSPRANAEPLATVVALVGAEGERARFAGFADHAGAVGAEATISVLDGEIPDAAVSADVVWLRGLSQSAAVMALARERRRLGRATILDVSVRDVQLVDTESRCPPTLSAGAAALAGVAGLATIPSARLQESLSALGVRAHVLPTLLARARWEELQQLRKRPNRHDPAVLGWHTGTDRGGAAPEHAAVRSVIGTLLRARPKLTVQIVGGATHVAGALASDDRVTVAPGDPGPGAIAAWTAQLWTTSVTEVEVSGDLRPAIEAHMLGVPTLANARNPAVCEGLITRALAVELPDVDDGWGAVGPLLDGGVDWSLRSQEAVRLADALYGPVTSAEVMNRLVGWMEFESPP